MQILYTFQTVKKNGVNQTARVLRRVCVLNIYSCSQTTIRVLQEVLIDFSLTVKAATLIFISGHGSAISSATERKSGFIYNLVKS